MKRKYTKPSKGRRAALKGWRTREDNRISTGLSNVMKWMLKYKPESWESRYSIVTKKTRKS